MRDFAELFSKEIRPISQGLHDVGSVRAHDDSHHKEHEAVLQPSVPPFGDYRNPHWEPSTSFIADFAISQRQSAAPTAAEIVASKIASSEYPADFIPSKSSWTTL